eukprot:1182658-Karenia_brevis.AAC.1
MGWRGPDITTHEAAKTIQELGLPEEVAQHIATYVKENGSVLEQMGADREVIEMIQSIHENSWFEIRDGFAYLTTAKGGRQGCKLGALVFNLLYAAALDALRCACKSEGVTLKIKVLEKGCLWQKRVREVKDNEEPCGEDITVDEVTYVDDEAILCTSRSPTKLITGMKNTAKVLEKTFQKFGMVVNWGPGKTEAMIALRGQ